AGNTFGGGSFINWACSLRLPHDVREEWARKFKLPYFVSKQFTESIEAVCQRNGVTEKGIVHNVPNQILMDSAKKLGYPHAVLPQNVGQNDHKCGFCSMGCPHGEKQGTHVTWLKDAADHGAHFIHQCKVDKVTHKNGQATGVVATTNSGVKVIVQARTVVASAGSLNTPLLLTRSGLKNWHIGRNLRLHPVLTVQAYFPDREVKPYYGPIMTAISTVVESRSGTGYGAKLEVPTLHPGLFGVFTPFRNALDYKRTLLQYNHRAMFIVLTRDEDSVSRVYEDAEGLLRVEFSLGGNDRKSLEEGAVASVKMFLAAGAREVDAHIFGLEVLRLDDKDLEECGGDAVNCKKAQEYYRRIREVGVIGQRTKLGSAHQMGTARMGVTPSAGAVDPEGQTWEVKGLYVADASLFPTASGVNPMITTLSMSHSVAQFIKRNLAKAGSKL
ncbi:GMC oxidoreductase-domain-containing protein, partial [Chytriomyces sp. MP71]